LGQLRYRDQACQISQVRAFVVKLDESVVLRIVSATQGRKRFVITKGWYS
jgi:hypothetical protein